MKEEWKIIKEFKDYEISNFGNVRRCTPCRRANIGKIIRSTINNSGYHCVTLRKDGKSYCKTIHRLVAEAYISNPNNYSDVDHIDRNKSNNTIPNLRWISHKDNMNNYDRSNAIKKQKETCRIKRELKKQILKEKVIKYRCYEINGKEYKTITDIVKETKKTYNEIKYYIRKNNIKKLTVFKKIYYY